VLSGKGVDIGETVTAGAVYVGTIAIGVWEGACKVIVATEPAEFWLVNWIGRLDLPGRLQAERTATSEMDIDRSLNVFNFTFVISLKIYLEQLDSYEPAELQLWSLLLSS
jgi:hypothetical protein